ncbi:MAG: shikimate dehydrogenase [Planctomycetota bacterium]
MTNIRPLHPIDVGTRVCAVFGDPVEHSLSPLVHNAAYRELGLDIVYVAHRVTDIASAIAGVRAQGNYLGVSITIPHKVAVMAFLDEIGELARRIGAVNTVTRTPEGRLLGTNTDGLGALRALRDAGADPGGRKIVVFGSGGAARAVAFALALEGRASAVYFLIREADQAEAARLVSELSECVPARFDVLTDRSAEAAMSEAEIVVQTTPLGMHPHVQQTPLDGRFFEAHHTVMDVVYNPLETRFLREARARGCHTVNGIEMFLFQAGAQIETWTCAKAPIGLMRSVLLERLQSSQLGAAPPHGP